ncbi:DUF4097 family beta strand repeat-containing protein [Paenibacillus sp. CAA11]|uniref:DUF4097 family beta strand repeat-containing protein n=1 Tax=Paenibacillus sp. CAA11 TaxID=1532905 RepID=UPI00131F481D|nr:DUF4097 family beta strand repeat-containing protein [Paenibacillus sp. CAA11]
MIKKWTFVALLLIVLGGAGMAVEGFKFGDDYPAYTQRWEFDNQELKNLLIDSDYSLDVEFAPGTSNTNVVEISGNMDQKSIDRLKSIQLQDHTLNLELKERMSRLFNISFQNQTQHMKVSLSDPAALEQFKAVLNSSNGTFSAVEARQGEISADSGNIKLTNSRVDDLKLSTHSGSIRGSQHTGSSLHVATVSGNISFEDYSSDTIIEGRSGNIRAEQMQGTMTVSNKSGDVTVEEWKGDGTFKLSSGNLRIEDQRSNNLDITVGSGDAKISEDPEFRGFYDLKAKSGDVSAPEAPQQTKDVIKIRTSSGDIKID